MKGENRMKTNNCWISLSLSVLMCFLLACPHTTPNPVAELEYYFPPNYVHQTIQIPETMRQSSDSVAQVVTQYIDLINESKKFLPYINPPDSILLESKVEPVWNYKWLAKEGFYLFLKISIYPDNSCGWEAKLWGTDTTTGQYYHNWIFLNAGQSSGKDQGSISPHYIDAPHIITSYSWGVADDTLKYIYYKISDEGKLFSDLEIHGCSDFSGELIKRIMISDTGFYLREYNGVIEYKYTWNVNGRGQWWRYDIEGNIIDSGVWN